MYLLYNLGERHLVPPRPKLRIHLNSKLGMLHIVVCFNMINVIQPACSAFSLVFPCCYVGSIKSGQEEQFIKRLFSLDLFYYFLKSLCFICYLGLVLIRQCTCVMMTFLHAEKRPLFTLCSVLVNK